MHSYMFHGLIRNKLFLILCQSWIFLLLISSCHIPAETPTCYFLTWICGIQRLSFDIFPLDLANRLSIISTGPMGTKLILENCTFEYVNQLSLRRVETAPFVLIMHFLNFLTWCSNNIRIRWSHKVNSTVSAFSWHFWAEHLLISCWQVWMFEGKCCITLLGLLICYSTSAQGYSHRLDNHQKAQTHMHQISAKLKLQMLL